MRMSVCMPDLSECAYRFIIRSLYQSVYTVGEKQNACLTLIDI